MSAVIDRTVGRLTFRVSARGWRARLGYGLVVAALVYLIVMPLYRLQARAFEDGGRGYQAQYGRSDTAEVLWTTVQLADRKSTRLNSSH